LAAGGTEKLAAIVVEMDVGLSGDVYQVTPEELEGIDRGLKPPGSDGSRRKNRSRPS